MQLTVLRPVGDAELRELIATYTPRRASPQQCCTVPADVTGTFVPVMMPTNQTYTHQSIKQAFEPSSSQAMRQTENLVSTGSQQ